jgi:hypothetical protein
MKSFSYPCGMKVIIKCLSSLNYLYLLFLASVRVLVDGGANHWHSLSRKFPDLVQLPNILCERSPDLSKIRRETLEVLRRHEEDVQVIKFDDDDKKKKQESDFTGALQLIIEKDEEKFKGVSQWVWHLEVGVVKASFLYL